MLAIPPQMRTAAYLFPMRFCSSRREVVTVQSNRASPRSSMPCGSHVSSILYPGVDHLVSGRLDHTKSFQYLHFGLVAKGKSVRAETTYLLTPPSGL